MKTTNSLFLAALLVPAFFGCMSARGADDGSVEEDEPAAKQRPSDPDPEPDPDPDPDPDHPGDVDPDPQPEPEPDCVDDEFDCHGSTLTYCAEGEWYDATCDDVCGLSGYTSDGCDDGVCNCDGFADEDCLLGVQALCACLEGTDMACSDEDFVGFYDLCFEGDPTLRCFGDYVWDGQVYCLDAIDACY